MSRWRGLGPQPLLLSPSNFQDHARWAGTFGSCIEPAAPCAPLRAELLSMHASGHAKTLLMMSRAGCPLRVQKRSCCGRCGTPTWSCTWARAWFPASRRAACPHSAWGLWAQGISHVQSTDQASAEEERHAMVFLTSTVCAGTRVRAVLTLGNPGAAGQFPFTMW